MKWAEMLQLFLSDIAEEKPLSKEENSLLTKVLRAKLVESTKEVEVQRKDPNSPLYSVKSFEELPLLVWLVYLIVYFHPS
jgi:ATP-dependent RNA helicase DDX19/DBP5